LSVAIGDEAAIVLKGHSYRTSLPSDGSYRICYLKCRCKVRDINNFWKYIYI
jgi:hypothetical protein